MKKVVSMVGTADGIVAACDDGSWYLMPSPTAAAVGDLETGRWYRGTPVPDTAAAKGKEDEEAIDG